LDFVKNLLYLLVILNQNAWSSYAEKFGHFATKLALTILNKKNHGKNSLFLPFLGVKNNHFYWLLSLSVRFCPNPQATPYKLFLRIW
jgi:hypothetical protein